MRINRVKPAHKSYFFGQGYKDISSAIKISWKRNAQTAELYYKKYNEKGLMSFKGIYNLFCALSVVSFGTIFFALISTVMVVFVSVFFMLVYVGFSGTWLFDRAYLARRKIFTACNECKSKSLIPIYICPKCGAQHTNLTPGVYGILRRKCNCGEKLPVTFFNGRRKLQAICPNCLLEGKTTYLNDRESRPLCIPVVGGRSVGKTAYITAFSKKFIEEVAPQNNLNIEFYNEAKKGIYSEIRTDFAYGNTRMTVRPQDITKSSSISFSFFIKNKSLKPERLMHIYDIAGEVFTDNNENEVQKQYEYCQGIIFIIDPFAIPTVMAKYEHMLTQEDRAGVGKADINGIINIFINKLREVTGLSDKKMSKVPIAVVIGKIDSANLWNEFSDEKIDEVRCLFPKVEIDHSDAIDYLCRKFMKENEMEGFVNAIDIKFKNNRFFVASAIGHTRGAGAYNPVGVLEPMEWICTQADKKLASLWVKNKYTKKPLSKTIDGLEA